MPFGRYTNNFRCLINAIVSGRFSVQCYHIQSYCVRLVRCPMLPCQIGSVPNVTVSNRFGVQCYCVQSVPCPILLCLNGLVSNPNVSNRFSVQSYCVQSVPFPRLLYYLSNPHVSNGFDHPIKLFVCPIGSVSNVAVSNRTCESNAVVMCPIVVCPILLCPIGLVSNRSVSNRNVRNWVPPAGSNNSKMLFESRIRNRRIITG